MLLMWKLLQKYSCTHKNEVPSKYQRPFKSNRQHNSASWFIILDNNLEKTFHHLMSYGTSKEIYRRLNARLSQTAKFMGPTGGPPGSCRPQVGPMLDPWTLLSGAVFPLLTQWGYCSLAISHQYYTRYLFCYILSMLYHILVKYWCDTHILQGLFTGTQTMITPVKGNVYPTNCESSA